MRNVFLNEMIKKINEKLKQRAALNRGYDGLIPQNQFARQMLSKTYDDKIQDHMTHPPQHGQGAFQKKNECKICLG